MKNILSFLVLFLLSASLFAQRETFDLTSYIAPNGWKKEVKGNSYTSFTSTNQQTKSYCQIFVMHSTASKGSLKEDYESEWKTLIANQYGVTDTPQLTDPLTDGGWQIKSGMASFAFNNGTSTAMLTTMTGYNKAVSIVSVTNSPDYLPAIQQFLESVEMKTVSNRPDNYQNQNSQSLSIPVNRGYAYTTTNFDDGWVAAEKENWVQVTKGNIIVLLHYSKEGTTIAADPEPHIINAWNILVAPRYSNLKNFKIASPSLDPQRAYLGAGDLTDNKTGKQVYVALFRKGSSGWIEFIAPDKNAFVREFGTDINNIGWDASSDIWNPLIKMFNYNKFAVSAGDLPGNWKSSSGAGIEYYNVYTGNNMGMASASSTTEFIFQQDGSYTSIYKGVDGFNGNNRYAGETCNGRAIVTNWEIQLTNRYKGATESFTAQFEAVKGGRILHMYRGSVEELHLFRMK
jgi:hypothetical protein